MMNTNPVSRRAAVKALAGAAGSLALNGVAAPLAHDRGPNKIRLENLNPGTRDWMLTKTRIDPTTRYRSPAIEGYASRTSVSAGQYLTFHVSTNPVSDFTIDIYRMGFYGGKAGRFMRHMGPFKGRVQPDPEVGPKRERLCQWEPCAQLLIPEEWVSGVYLAKLTELNEGIQSYIIFIVRDQREASYLFQCSDNTWQAYNRWPSQFSLYDDGKSEWYWGGGVRVGFNRPYGKYCQIVDQPLSIGSGEFFLWEYPFVYWLEAHGYDVSYISNADTHFDRAGLLRADGLLSVGHDEYWTIQMYRNVEAAILAGVSVGFFSGNAVCGRILEGDPKLRSFERVGVYGPPGGTREFVSMSSLKHERPYANELVGAHSTGPVTGGADWICTRPDHWIYRDTRMKEGDRIPGLIGWEWHGDPAPIKGLEIVATGPTQDAPGKPNGGVYTATTYPGPKTNIVFNAATCWWADGLAEPPGYLHPKVYTEPKGPDPRVQQITHNVLRRMLGR